MRTKALSNSFQIAIVHKKARWRDGRHSQELESGILSGWYPRPRGHSWFTTVVESEAEQTRFRLAIES
jgi:hypothetical protein